MSDGASLKRGKPGLSDAQSSRTRASPRSAALCSAHASSRYPSRLPRRDTLDAPLSPTNANRYAYAGDDPINLYDPTGFGACSYALFGTGLGLLLTGASAFTGGATLPFAAGLLVTALGAGGAVDSCDGPEPNPWYVDSTPPEY